MEIEERIKKLHNMKWGVAKGILEATLDGKSVEQILDNAEDEVKVMREVQCLVCSGEGILVEEDGEHYVRLVDEVENGKRKDGPEMYV